MSIYSDRVPIRAGAGSIPARNGGGRFAEGLEVQWRIIYALILREINSRFGRENIGYLWMIGEPLMLASVITLIHLAQPNHFSSDITPAPFAIIGYTIFIIFRGMVTKAEFAVENNLPLFYHRTVSVFDVMTARAIIETAGCVATIVILMSIAILTDVAQFPARPLVLLAAIGLMVWWAFAISMITARVAYRNELVARQVHVVTYFCIPISGAFFTMSAVPGSIRDVLAWFPMTLIFEQARFGQFQYASSEFVAPAYVCAVNAVLTYVGILLVRRIRANL